MRVLNRFRQKLSVVLMASMVATMAVPPVTGLAEETAHPVWKLEDGGWRLYKKDGSGYYKNKVKLQAGKWYAFDDEGWMFSNTLLKSPDLDYGDPNGMYNQFYAFPDGHLAAKNWVRLDSDGQLFDDYGDIDSENDIRWYYFNSGEDASGNVVGPGTLVRNKVKTINRKIYAFDKEGVMLSREWVDKVSAEIAPLEDFEENSGSLVFLQFEGNAATDKWLPIGDFWYEFGSDGSVKNAVPIASDSDAVDPTGFFIADDSMIVTKASDSNTSDDDLVYHAPARVIEKFELDGSTNRSLPVGQSLTLRFKATLASDSNAERDGFSADYHDIWASANKNGKIEASFDSSKYEIKIKYTQSTPACDEFQIYIDGQPADSDPVVITPVLEESTSQKKALNSILDSVEDLTPTQLQSQLTTTYGAATTEEQKQNLQSVLLESDSFDQISSSYAMQMMIVETTNVSDAAAEQLNGDVSIVGGALNADKEDTVALKVETAETPTLTDDTYKAKLAFDITLDINDDPVSELSVPVKITMPVPASFATGIFDLIHIHGETETKVPYTLKTVDGVTYMTFMADRFSTFVFAKTDSNNNGNGSGGSGSSGGSSGGGSGSSNSSAGIVTTDAKKGKVNSVTGIITGSGAGYSKWESVTAQNGAVTWKLQYADGTYAAGTMKTKADGTAYEQVAWEQINGAWYPFGADGFAKTGFVYDADLGGYFYVDTNAGMETGWTLIDGKWYYLNPTADGKRGMMLTDTTVGGYRLGSDGVWVE